VAQIRVMSRNKAIRYSYSDHPLTLIISIRDVGRAIPHFHKGNLIIHYFEFDDVEENSAHGFPISTEQAQEIVKVIKSTPVDDIVVHCEAGVSRSAGVAAAIGMFLNNDDSFIFNDGRYCPNNTCYRKVMEAFGLKNDGSVFAQKFDTNLKAWRKYNGLEE
jgi:hypothetical protein